ncbi:MAG: hypothetical protein PF569_09375 [Candidatus Woesearchaeota archaeon]|jgi:hypothetical protein|nr:hypothetical protein [Candidatus Woesearchaeota archaeon]
MITNNKELDNLQDKIDDIINHPPDDLDYISNLRNDINFSEVELQDLKSAFGKIMNNDKLSDEKKMDYTANSWKVSFKERPPSVAEFLTHEYIGGTADNLFPYMKGMMEDFFDIKNPYRHLILALPIGVGKSMLAMLILAYISTYYALLRNPKQYLNQASHAMMTIAIMAISQSKAEEITTRPLLNLLGNSEKFKRCKTEEQLERYKLEYPSNICYTTASTKGSIFRIDDLYFKQVSQVSDLLGLNILSSTCTEISFFKEAGKGWTDEKVMRFYTDLKGRMYSRFQNNWLSRSILDSSPNTMEDSITQYIYNDAYKNPENLVLQGAKWDYQIWQFPIFEKDRTKTFPVYLGTASSPPKILQPSEVELFDPTEVMDFPNDIRVLAEDSLTKCIKDYGGRPSAVAEKLVNLNHIEPLFSPQLKNIYTYINAPANLPPEGLIWNKIKDIFFYKAQNGKYEFYRNPNAKRYVSVDQSYVTDFTGIAVSHVEINKQGELVYITDMAITIAPTKDKINLEAIKFFIRDLRREGTMNISRVSFDQFQSQPTIQYLELHGFNVEKLSVESTTEPYINYLALMSRGCAKMGKSLIMKNNLKSLIMSKTKGGKPKIDHSNGDVVTDLNNIDWDTSKLGYNMNDLSDSVVASVHLCSIYGSKAPSYIWEEVESMEESMKNKEQKLHTSILENYKLKRRTAT